ncbi:MAG: hypothetical protein SGPRY_012645 [Prymnesium sp.]
MDRRGVHRASGRGIIADTGYGVGGALTGHVFSWDDEATLQARIADGVVGVTQSRPGYAWNFTLDFLRPRLREPSECAWPAPLSLPLHPPAPLDAAAFSSAWREATGYMAVGALGIAFLCMLTKRMHRALKACLRRRAILGIVSAGTSGGREKLQRGVGQPRPSKRRAQAASHFPPSSSEENLDSTGVELDSDEEAEVYSSRSAPIITRKPMPRKPKEKALLASGPVVPFRKARRGSRSCNSVDVNNESADEMLMRG